MAKIYYANGNVKEVTPKNGTDFSYEEMKEVVEGYIEIVPLGEENYMVVNEEGKLIGLPFNVKASELFQKYNGFDMIAGNALVCAESEIK